MHLTLFRTSRASHGAVGAASIRPLLHGLDALTTGGFAFPAQANALFHAIHSFTCVTTLPTSFGALFAVFDAFLHRYFHLHAAYYAPALGLLQSGVGIPNI